MGKTRRSGAEAFYFISGTLIIIATTGALSRVQNLNSRKYRVGATKCHNLVSTL